MGVDQARGTKSSVQGMYRGRRWIAASGAGGRAVASVRSGLS